MSPRGTPPFFYLRADENVLLRLKPERSWALATFVGLALVATTLEALALGVLSRAPGAPAWTQPLVMGLYIAALTGAAVFAWRRWATSEYALTDARIYARHGKLRTRVHFTMHDRITDIRYQQGPLDRLFGVSRLTFATAGGDVSLVGIRDAIAVKEATETARDDFLQRLLERAGLDQQAREAAAASAKRAEPAAAAEGLEPGAAGAPPRLERAAPPPPARWAGPRPPYLKAGDVPVWYGKPRPVAALSALIPFAGIIPFVLISGIAGGGAGLLSLPLLLVVAAGMAGLRVWQLSRIEYTVTDKRVYARSGIFGTTVTQLTYDKITDITYRQDLLGRLLGYGGVTVNTAGSNQAPVQMIGLSRPLDVQATLEAARARYLREEDGS